MITILPGGGVGGSLGTPKSDYVICARPLRIITIRYLEPKVHFFLWYKASLVILSQNRAQKVCVDLNFWSWTAVYVRDCRSLSSFTDELRPVNRLFGCDHALDHIYLQAHMPYKSSENPSNKPDDLMVIGFSRLTYWPPWWTPSTPQRTYQMWPLILWDANRPPPWPPRTPLMYPLAPWDHQDVSLAP